MAAAAAVGVLAVAAMAPAESGAQSLKGSKASVDRMYSFAVGRRIPFYQTEAQVDQARDAGRLVPLTGSPTYELSGGVGWPWVTRETRAFVEAFSQQYAGACGTPMMVTSATRPRDRTPRNGSPKSVHPAGIAIDLRRPASGPCLDWLRGSLAALEARGVIEATEERHPVHLHVAVLVTPGGRATIPALRLAGLDPFDGKRWPPAGGVAGPAATVASAAPAAAAPSAPQPALNSRDGASDRARAVLAMFTPTGPQSALGASFLTFGRSSLSLAAPTGRTVSVSAGEVALAPRPAARPAQPGTPAAQPARATQVAAASPAPKPAAADTQPERSYKVRQGDTLWDIARRHGLRVDAILAANHLSSGRSIRPGTVLRLPGEPTSTAQ
jgi:LysM repeat protein